MNLTIIFNFIQYLQQSKLFWIYFILFFGSYFETVIGFSFFVYGELFFLAGAILAGLGVLNIYLVSAVFFIGGILGDNTSYVLGYKFGDKIYGFFSRIWFFKKYFTKKNYTLMEKYFRKHGGKSVFLARFLGPISWITPFFAGVFKLRYGSFIAHEVPAAILGISQFIVIGYLFGKGFNGVTKYIGHSPIIIIISVIIFCVVAYLLFKFFKKESKLLAQ